MIQLDYYKNTNSIVKFVEVIEVVQIDKTVKLRFFAKPRETFVWTFLLQKFVELLLFIDFIPHFFVFLPRKIFIENLFCLFLFNVNPHKVKWDIHLDVEIKLHVHKTFRRCPGHVLNVLCTFNLRSVSRGSEPWRKIVHYSSNSPLTLQLMLIIPKTA